MAIEPSEPSEVSADCSGDDILSAITDGLETLRSGIAIFDSRDALIFCNPQFHYVFSSLRDAGPLLGQTYEAILARLVANGEFAGGEVIRDPDNWIAERMERHQRQGSFATEQLADGRWVEVKERRTRGGRTVVQWNDVTAATMDRYRFEDAVEASADGFAAWDQADRLRLFNSRFSKIMGTPGDQIEIGMTYTRVAETLAHSGHLLPDNAGEWLRKWHKGRRRATFAIDMDLADGRVYLVRERRIRDGGQVTTLTDVTAFKERERTLVYRGKSLQAALDDSEMSRMVMEDHGSLLADLAEKLDAAKKDTETQRERIKALLQEARSHENHLAAILETIGDPLVTADSEGRIASFNRAAEETFGYRRQEIGSLTIDLILAPDVAQPPARLLSEISRRRLPDAPTVPVEIEGRRADGSLFPAEIMVATVETVGAPFYVASIRDITDRKTVEKARQRARQQLEEQVRRQTDDLRGAIEKAELANRAKDQMLANVSHELRTPLNSIIGFSEVILGHMFGELGNDRYKTYIADIHGAGTHLLRLINDLLDVARIDTDEARLIEEELSVPAVVAACKRLVVNRAESQRIEIREFHAEDLPRLFADERRIKQILVNLLDNGIKFTPRGGVVTITTSLSDNGLVIAVSDTGIGIAEDRLDEVMSPFIQADGSLARRFEGAGLGLALAKKLTEVHGGTLKLRSRLGEGTTAELHLPTSRLRA